jgi:hypothetical protein
LRLSNSTKRWQLIWGKASLPAAGPVGGGRSSRRIRGGRCAPHMLLPSTSVFFTRVVCVKRPNSSNQPTHCLSIRTRDSVLNFSRKCLFQMYRWRKALATEMMVRRRLKKCKRRTSAFIATKKCLLLAFLRHAIAFLQPARL